MSAELFQKWINAKEAEEKHRTTRRNIEDMILEQYFKNDKENHRGEFHEVTIKHRRKYEVNEALLMEIAGPHGLDHQLDQFFQWPIVVNPRNWENSDNEAKAALSPAVKTKEGRPSFSITRI